jgi:AcrR family transcriptional regulator
MGELVHERDPGTVTVAHVVERSGVSRRTFYELFKDREDCFLAAFDTAIAMAAETALPAYAAPGSWRERVRAGLEAMLCFLDAEPELGYLCVVGALGNGDRALERRARVISRLVEAVHEGRRESRGTRRPDRLTAEGLVGAVLAVIHARLVEQSARPLLSLLNPLMGMIVLPYQGAAASEREQRHPTPRARKPTAPRSNPLRELDMRLTYRTVRVLLAIADLGRHRSAGERAPSNRQIATAAGISDQGQISKLLARLLALGLIANSGGDHAKGEPNAWTLTHRGQEVTQTLRCLPPAGTRS